MRYTTLSVCIYGLVALLCAVGCMSERESGAADATPQPPADTAPPDSARAQGPDTAVATPDAHSGHMGHTADTGGGPVTDAARPNDARTQDARPVPDAAAECPRDLEFSDYRGQIVQFIGYNSSIVLTDAQEEIKRQALEAMPAPCCDDNTAYTCCCPCNLSKTIWGLSHFLIARHGCSPAVVREIVQRWIAFLNPDGFSGDVCYTGGCERAFRRNGCGGMSEDHIVFD